MLLLLFQLGPNRYALEARRAVEVLPFLAQTTVPHAPRAVAGLFNYRGCPVTAVDLSVLLTGRPAREWFSTRIIVLRIADHQGQPQWLGLIAERATGLLRCDPRALARAALPADAAPGLGPIVMDDKGLIQLLHPEQLLTENLRRTIAAAPIPPRAPDRTLENPRPAPDA